MPLITVPKKLSEKLGEEASEALVEMLRQLQEETVARAIEVVEERFAWRLSEEIGKLRADIQADMGRIRAEMGQLRADVYRDMGQLEARLTGKIESLRSDMTERIEGLRTEMKTEIEGLRTEMKTEIEGLRSEMYRLQSNIVRWMFIQFIALAGLLFALLRFVR